MDHDACYDALDALLDYRKLPTYTPDTDYDRIDGLAEQAYQRDTFDGYLSYVLMANQVCEEYTRVLVRHAQFFLGLHTVTRGFSWTPPSAQTGRHLNEVMFGRLLELLEHSVDFGNKKEWIETCRALNQIRNRMAHQIGRNATLEDIRQSAEQFKRRYDTVVHLFNDADEEFSWHYFEMVHDVMFDTIIAFELGTESSDAHKARWLDLQTRLDEERNSYVHRNRGPNRFVHRR